MRMAFETIEGFRFKICMFGVLLDGPNDVFFDNLEVVKIYQRTNIRFSKKHNAICYHRVHETVSDGYVRLASDTTKTFFSDLFTKILPGLKRYQLVTDILCLNNVLGRRFIQVGLDGPTGHGRLYGEYMGQVLYLYR